jgi:hypothetical protein
MIKLLRILQIVDGLLILPMLALGFMSSLSGGGMTPAFQEIGQRMIATVLYLPVPCIIIAEILHRRTSFTWAGVVFAAIPLVVWAWLVLRLQVATGFFSG